MKTKQIWFWFCFIWLLFLVGENGKAAESVWKVVKEPSRSDVLYRLSFADANHGWGIGRRAGDHSFVGFRTEQGGNTWQEIHIPDFRKPVFWAVADMDAYSVFLLTSQEGWIGGAERIAHSVDGGETWELIFLRERMLITLEVQKLLDWIRLNIYSIHFFSPQEGLVLCMRRWKGD